jgi:hypothetical protein
MHSPRRNYGSHTKVSGRGHSKQFVGLLHLRELMAQSRTITVIRKLRDHRFSVITLILILAESAACSPDPFASIHGQTLRDITVKRMKALP